MEETDEARDCNWNSPQKSIRRGGRGRAAQEDTPGQQRNAAIPPLLRPGETELETGGPGAVRVELAASHPRIGKQALQPSKHITLSCSPSIFLFLLLLV